MRPEYPTWYINFRTRRLCIDRLVRQADSFAMLVHDMHQRGIAHLNITGNKVIVQHNRCTQDCYSILDSGGYVRHRAWLKILCRDVFVRFTWLVRLLQMRLTHSIFIIRVLDVLRELGVTADARTQWLRSRSEMNVPYREVLARYISGIIYPQSKHTIGRAAATTSTLQ